MVRLLDLLYFKKHKNSEKLDYPYEYDGTYWYGQNAQIGKFMNG